MRRLRHKERGRDVLPLEHLFSKFIQQITLLFPEYAGQYYRKRQEDALQNLGEFPVTENIQPVTGVMLLFAGVHGRRF